MQSISTNSRRSFLAGAASIVTLAAAGCTTATPPIDISAKVLVVQSQDETEQLETFT